MVARRQVFPAYDPEVRLDELDNKCEPAAALYEAHPPNVYEP